jgi:hypothetical protein
VLIYGGNVFGPPPPSVPAVAWSAQALWLLVLWAFWVDRHRLPKRTVEGVAHRHTVTSEVEPGE